MIDEKLLSKAKEKIDNGEARNEILNDLLNQGYSLYDINSAYDISVSSKSRSDKEVESSIKEIKAVIKPVFFLRGVGALLKESASVYKKYFLLLIAVSAIPSIFNLGTVIFTGFASSISAGANLVLSLYAQLATIYVIRETDQASTLADAFRIAQKRIFSFTFLTLLYIVLLIEGFLSFFIPGLIFFVWFAFYIFIFAEKNKKGFNALHISREYTRGFWWKIFNRIFAVLLIYSILYGSLVFLPFRYGFPDTTLYGLSNLVLDLFAAPFIIIYLRQIYLDLKDIKGEIAVQIKFIDKLMYFLWPLIILISVMAIYTLFRFILV